MDCLNHPIVKKHTQVKVVAKRENTGIWVPPSNWETLTVDTGNGVILQNVRHRRYGNSRAFEVKVGDTVSIQWWDRVADGLEPWYYTSHPSS